ncbi:hypothetical protein OF83DRAFT_1161971 [Amylostereum chailletii]|nr:hypothetical protein OF83DRAFT_1161971 [Amylostereum chailletii]
MVQTWEPGTSYGYGDVVEYEGARYKIIQPHRSQGDWTPNVTPALWGRLVQGDDGEHRDEHEHRHGQEPYSYGDQSSFEKPTYQSSHPDQSVEVPHEEQKKHWWDLDDDRKKQVEIGGGLLAGAAAIAGGYYAYRKHEKSEEQEKALTWGLQSWLRDAQARTDQFRREGPRAPATWVLVNGPITTPPQGALIAGRSKDGSPLYVARAFHEGSIRTYHVKLSLAAALGTFDILIGDQRAVRWEGFSNSFRAESFRARPVEGGREADGTPLYVCQVDHEGAVVPGKCSANLSGGYIVWGGKEKSIDNYRVLCYN